MVSSSDSEQEQKRDQQRKDAERLGNGKAENQIAELALRRRRVTQRGRQIIAENNSDADASTPHADAGDAGSNIFRGSRVHEQLLFPFTSNGLSMARVYRIVEIDAGENGEHVGLQKRDQDFERDQHHDHEER